MYSHKTKSWRKNTPDSAFPRTLKSNGSFSYFALYACQVATVAVTLNGQTSKNIFLSEKGK